MDSNKEINLPVQDEVNPLTARRHRREFWGQILVPIIFLFALIVAGVYFLLSRNSVSIANMAQIASMLMMLPIIFATIFLFILSIAMIYLLAILMKWIPPKANQIQNVISRITYRIKQSADIASEGIIFIESWAKAVRKTFDRFL